MIDPVTFGKGVIQTEADTLLRLTKLIDGTFERAVRMLLACAGNVVVTGVGKPWLIGQKISATFASTGTPSFALHAAEAAHGDLGRVRRQDVVLALSNSGASEELTRLLPLIKREGVPLIGVTGNPESELARHSDVVLPLGRIEEACPLKLAPSASTTAMLALGDALALTLMEARGFGKDDYARFHPAGALGRKLMRVEDAMRPLERTAVMRPRQTVKETLFTITKMRSGAAFIVDDEGKLLGVFTDGDLRRHIDRTPDLLARAISEVMTAPGIRCIAGELAGEAARVMNDRSIDELPVVDRQGILKGHLDVQDVLATGLV